MKNNRGFSMVELIIVIAIMAILAGAVAPTLIKYVNKSRRSADIDNAQSLATAAQTALIEQVIAEYIYTKTLPYTVDVSSLDSSDVFENFILEKFGQMPAIRYRKSNATKYEITVYKSGAGDTDYGIEVSIDVAKTTCEGRAYTANNAAGHATLYPLLDDVYADN